MLHCVAGLQDLSSLTRDLTRTLGSESRGPNHWTAREFPVFVLMFFSFMEVKVKVLFNIMDFLSKPVSYY